MTVENVHPNTTVSFRMNNLSGSAADLKLYAYGADGKLAEVSKELWTITDESGTGVDTLTDGTLYELRVSVADDGALDLSEAEKEIIIPLCFQSKSPERLRCFWHRSLSYSAIVLYFLHYGKFISFVYLMMLRIVDFLINS